MPFVLLIVWALLVRWIAREEGWPDDPIGWVICGMMMTISAGLFIAAGLGLAAWIGSSLPERMDATPSYTAQLVSLRSADGVSGHISGGAFLVVGQIGSDQYYFWYEQSGQAVTPRHEAVGVGVYVYEQDRADAEIQRFDWHFRSKAWKLIAFESGGTTTRFYVPKGTVARTFTLQ